MMIGFKINTYTELNFRILISMIHYNLNQWYKYSDYYKNFNNFINYSKYIVFINYIN